MVESFLPPSCCPSIKVEWWFYQIQADLINSGGVVIPQVYIPLNASSCMCESLMHLANRIHHPIIQPGSCHANDLCNGITCAFRNIFGDRLELHMTLLPCQGNLTLAVDRELNTGNGTHEQVLFIASFNHSLTEMVNIFGANLTAESSILQHSYSMEVQVQCILYNIYNCYHAIRS